MFVEIITHTFKKKETTNFGTIIILLLIILITCMNLITVYTITVYNMFDMVSKQDLYRIYTVHADMKLFKIFKDTVHRDGRRLTRFDDGTKGITDNENNEGAIYTQ